MKYVIIWLVSSIILLFIIASYTGYEKSLYEDSIWNEYKSRLDACPMVPICNVVKKECNGSNGWYDCSTRECKDRKDKNCLTRVYKEQLEKAEKTKMSFGDKIKHTLGGKTIYSNTKHNPDSVRSVHRKARTIAFYIISFVLFPIILILFYIST